MRVHAELRSELRALTGKDVYPMFVRHRSNAKQRGIEFNMTFPQWVRSWGSDITNRGTRKGQKVMCRPGDVGPYEEGHVQIRSGRSNVQESHRLRNVATVKAAWTIDGQDRTSCVDWLENRRDMGYF